MADKKRNGVVLLRGILGPLSGTTIDIQFNKNNTVQTKGGKTKMAPVKEWYFVGGYLPCNKKTICGKIKAFSKEQAEKKFLKSCDCITIICVRKITV